MRLEHDVDMFVAQRRGSSERRLDLGGMMAVIVNHRDAVDIAHVGKATADAFKTRKCLSGGVDIEA